MAINDIPPINVTGAALAVVGALTAFGAMFKASVLGFYPSEFLGIMVAMGIAIACLLIGSRLFHTPLPPRPKPRAQVRPAAPPTAQDIALEAEAAGLARAELASKEAKRREHFAASGDSLTTLLADPQIASEAQKVRRIYGRSTCLSFLKRKATELGLEDTSFTEDDLPDTF